MGEKKICSFNCPYCDLGPSEVRMNQIKRGEVQLPTPLDVDQAFRKAVRDLRESRTKFDVITISGNGEPTLHPEFAAIVQLLLIARGEMCPGIPINVLSNGAHLDNKHVVTAMNELDGRVVKLDAGNDRTLKAVNSPLVRSNTTKIYAGYRKLNELIVQSFFIKGPIDNTRNEDIEDWIEIIGIVQPKLVQICSIDRPPLDPHLQRADEDTLYTIASKLKRRTQIESAVFL